VVIQASNREDAASAFERLRQTVEDHNFAQLDKVTISVGFVEVIGHQTAADIIGDADKALYYAKNHGRNRVVSFEQLVEQGEIEVAAKIIYNDVELF